MDADQTCELIISFVRKSNLNFSLIETPFSVSIEIKKAFIKNKNGLPRASKLSRENEIFSDEKREESDKIKKDKGDLLPPSTNTKVTLPTVNTSPFTVMPLSIKVQTNTNSFLTPLNKPKDNTTPSYPHFHSNNNDPLPLPISNCSKKIQYMNTQTLPPSMNIPCFKSTMAHPTIDMAPDFLSPRTPPALRNPKTPPGPSSPRASPGPCPSSPRTPPGPYPNSPRTPPDPRCSRTPSTSAPPGFPSPRTALNILPFPPGTPPSVLGFTAADFEMSSEEFDHFMEVMKKNEPENIIDNVSDVKD